MTNLKHTPGPWEAFEKAEGGYSIESYVESGAWATVAHALDPNNAARIVACVNACEGISPEAVPNLLEALEAIQVIAYAQVDGNKGDMRAALMESIKQARAAIAKAKCK